MTLKSLARRALHPIVDPIARRWLARERLIMRNEVHYAHKAAVVRKLVDAYRSCELGCSAWPQDRLERLAEISMDALSEIGDPNRRH